jgi:hypothetical protein
VGRLAVVQSVEDNADGGENVRDVVIDLGGGDVSRVALFGASGDDAPPLPGDYCVEVDGACVATADPENAGTAVSGERRIYARDSSGNVVAQVYLRGDGTIFVSNGQGEILLQGAKIRLSNGSGFVELAASGAVSINGNLEVLT